jgi:EAL domain-containing protein (putative c-di-GMP-specific phosphodiesterase class I)
VLKIDRSFVAPLLHDRSAYAIVKAVLGMCADLGLSTVAEGIEDEAQRDALRAMGCSHGQGYLFGHAEPLATRQPVVRRNRCTDTGRGQTSASHWAGGEA